MRTRPALLAASAVVLLAVLVGGWLLMRPVDPAGGTVPAPITVPGRSPATVPPAPLPTTPAPAPATVPEPVPVPGDVVPPPPVPDDDDDGPDDDGPDDDDDG